MAKKKVGTQSGRPPSVPSELKLLFCNFEGDIDLIAYWKLGCEFTGASSQFPHIELNSW